MKIGDRVRLEYPGFPLHKLQGVIEGIVWDDFLGTIYAVKFNNISEAIGFTATQLRPVMAPFDKRSGARGA